MAAHPSMISDLALAGKVKEPLHREGALANRATGLTINVDKVRVRIKNEPQTAWQLV
jgi:hypothetical protein